MNLNLDTSDTGRITVILSGNDRRFRAEADERSRAEQILALVDKVCTDAGISLKGITDITVSTGPGSYTGLRVGLAVAQMLAVLLDIPLNGTREYHKIKLQYRDDLFAVSPGRMD